MRVLLPYSEKRPNQQITSQNRQESMNKYKYVLTKINTIQILRDKRSPRWFKFKYLAY